MDASKPTRQAVHRAAHAIVALATVALRLEYLRWDKNVNLGMVEIIWNIRGRELSTAPVADSGGPALARDAEFGHLCETLTAWVRAHRSQRDGLDEDVMVFGLDAQRKGTEIIFRFDLTWDELKTRHPCEIVWDLHDVSASRN